MNDATRIHSGFRRSLVTASVGAILLAAPAAHAAKGDCSQPASTGSAPAASDCLYILRVAVGSLTCTPACICAPLGSLPTKTSDALLCLRKSVGQGVTLNCPCGPPDGDNFNDNVKNPDLWGTDIVHDGSGVLVETSARLEWRSSATTGLHYTSRPWIGSELPYTSNWEAQVDITNLTTPTQNDELASMALSVFDASNSGNEVYLEFYASHYDEPPARNGFYGDLYANDTFVEFVDNFATDQVAVNGAVRVTFNATSKVLTLFYDEDRTDGYDWTELGSFGVDGNGGADGNANWGLGAGDRFTLALSGYADEMPVAAGKLFADNFSVTGGVTP